MPTTDDVVMRRRVDRHRAPATPHVEQAGTGVLGQPELAAHQLVLGGLGRRQIGVGLGEPGARVGHRRAEHEGVEVVADVVVVADRVGVATQRVPAAAEMGLLGRLRKRTSEHAQAARRGHDLAGRPQACSRPGVEGGAEGGDDLEEVAVDLQLAGDEAAGQAELVRAPQQPAHGVGADQPQRGAQIAAGRGDAAAVPALDVHRQVVTEQPGDTGRRWSAAVGPARCWRVSSPTSIRSITNRSSLRPAAVIQLKSMSGAFDRVEGVGDPAGPRRRVQRRLPSSRPLRAPGSRGRR